MSRFEQYERMDDEQFNGAMRWERTKAILCIVGVILYTVVACYVVSRPGF